MKITIVLIVCCIALGGTAAAKDINEQWSITFTERFRLVTWDNAISLDDTASTSRTFTRHRTQLGVTWKPDPILTVGFQLANEFRYHAQPSTTEFDFDEIFIDQLYGTLTRPLDLPVILTLGRQNIILGEGFIMLDGSPLDGSRSIYFNAARLDWEIAANHRLTSIFVYDEETDAWLPVVHEQDQALVEQDEKGGGLYYTGQFHRLTANGYWIYKHRSCNDAIPFGSDINTVGGRIAADLTEKANLKLIAEGALQFGDRGNNDRSAYGGYGYVQYKPGPAQSAFYIPAELRAGVIYLSGDDPSTDEYEGWDPMFARWPKWSESYIYTQIREDGVAWWTNLVSLNARVQFALAEEVDLRFDYHHLSAPESKGVSSGFPGGDGTTRGDLFIGKLMYRFDTHWSGHLLWEGFEPGDYYFDGADSYAWIRTELMFRF